MHLVVLGFLKTNVAGPAPQALRTHISTSHLTHPMAPAHAWSPNMTGHEVPKGLPTQTNEIHQPQMGGSRVCMPFRMSHRTCPSENVAVIGCLRLVIGIVQVCHSWDASGLATCAVKWPSYLRVFVCVFAFVVWLLVCVPPPYRPLTQVPT